jgi:type I restriction enzyme M protein
MLRTWRSRPHRLMGHSSSSLRLKGIPHYLGFEDQLWPTTDLKFEAQLWQTADALRGSMDAAEYKHVVLGLIFLKYISDAFEEQHARLETEIAQGADPEDPDEYRALGIFWVPPEARWSHLKAQARQPTIGTLVDDAMIGVERDNPSLNGVLPKDYARPALDKERLGQLIDLISNIRVGDTQSRSRDVLGRVYEYFLSQFASAEGKKGGEFYTPRSVVRLLVEMLEPFKGRVYDPCCGSSGMFVQSEEFIEAHGGRLDDISILRSGVQLHYLATREDEPRHPRDRGPDRPRRQLPQRPLPGPQG